MHCSSFRASFLSDAHTAKDHEIRQAVSDLETRYSEVTVSLAEFKHRALTAEVRPLTVKQVQHMLIPCSCNLKRTDPLHPKLRIWRRS